MKYFVVDASVSLCWCFENQTSRYTEGVLEMLAGGAAASVPFLWPIEMSNALVLAQRRGNMTLAKMTALVEEINEWPIHVDVAGLHRAFHQILALARERNLSAYDAAYLELALRERLPLATLDRKLRKAAQAVGIAIV